MLNPNIKLIPVSKAGYSNSDLGHQYYSGVMLLHKEGDKYTVRECGGYDEGSFIFYGGSRESDVSTLFRFIPEVGFYKLRSGEIIRYDYKVRKTYKKSLSVQHTAFNHLSGMPYRFSSRSDRLRVVQDMVEAQPEPYTGDNFVISRRLCVSGGKLITFHNSLTVGDCKDGIAITPIPAIIDRISEVTQGAIQCQQP